MYLPFFPLHSIFISMRQDCRYSLKKEQRDTLVPDALIFFSRESSTHGRLPAIFVMGFVHRTLGFERYFEEAFLYNRL